MSTPWFLRDELDRRQFMAGAARALLGVGLGSSMASLYGEDALLEEIIRKPTARRVICLFMNGGMSHMDTLDPKPNSKLAGPVKAIKTSADGIQLSQYMPNVAQQMHHACLVRSMTSTQGAHGQGQYYMRTSYVMRGTISHPSLGSWVSNWMGKNNPTIPGYVRIGNGGNNIGNGYMEAKHGPLPIGNPEAGLQHAVLHRSVDNERFEKRLQLSQAMSEEFLNRYGSKNVRAHSDMYHDAVRLMGSKDLEAFSIVGESQEMRDFYGNHRFGQGCLLARRLCEHGVRFVEVNLGGWDTHTNNFERVEDNCQQLDQSVAALIQDLYRRGMLDETIILLASEFGRTPNINQNTGRDHYPKAFSYMLAGGGIKGGYVYGATDENAAVITENPVLPVDINATVATALGLDTTKTLYSPNGRPFTIAHKGKPVYELFT